MIAGGSILGQGAVVLVTPLLTRTYGTAEFAILAIYTSITLILGPTIVLRMDGALGLPRREIEATAVAWLGIVSAFVLTLLIAAAGLAFGDSIGRTLRTDDFRDMVWLIALGVFTLALDQISLGWMMRKQRYAAIARRNLASGLTIASAQVLFGYLEVPYGLIFGLVLGRAVAIAGMFGREGLIRNPLPQGGAMRQAASRYRRFIYVSSWSTLINGIGVQAPILVISACYGGSAVAALGLAIRVLAAPLAIVGLAVSRVFQGQVSDSIRVGRSDLSSQFRRTAVLLAVLGAVPAVVLAGFGPALFAVVFGSEWRLAGTLAALLAVGLYAQFIVSPLASLPTLLEHQFLQIAWDVVRMLATIILPLAAYWNGADLQVATLVLGLTFAVMYGSFYLMSDRLAVKHDRLVRNRHPAMDS